MILKLEGISVSRLPVFGQKLSQQVTNELNEKLGETFGVEIKATGLDMLGLTQEWRDKFKAMMKAEQGQE